MATTTLAVIVGNRDFFPDVLVTEARREILGLLSDMQIEPVILDERQTKLGGVETHADARRCADLFRAHRDKIDGVLVTLPAGAVALFVLLVDEVDEAYANIYSTTMSAHNAATSGN